MQLRWPVSASRLAAMAIVAASFLSVLVLDLPGHLSYDSVVQLLEGRTGVYGDWHPPVMSWLLGLGDAIHPGTALFTGFDAYLLYASLLALLWTRPRVSWAAAPVALACALTPQWLIYQGIVWKDVLFANASLAGFVCLAHAAENWAMPRRRFSLLGLGFLFLALATLARQNGIVMLLTAAIGLAFVARLQPDTKSLWKPLGYGTAALLCALAVVFAAQAALKLRVETESGPGAQIALLQAYDIAGALKADPSLDLAEIRKRDPAAEAPLRAKWPSLFSLRWVDTLEEDYGPRSDDDPALPGAIRAQWLDLVTRHPFLYLKLRAEVFRWVFTTPFEGSDLCLPYVTGATGPPEKMAALGLAPRSTATDDALDDYAAAFLATPVMSHAAYAVVAFAALILLIRRRRPADIAMASMLVAALLFTLSFFVISISCDYRYLYALDLAAMVAALYVAADPAGLIARRAASP